MLMHRYLAWRATKAIFITLLIVTIFTYAVSLVQTINLSNNHSEISSLEVLKLNGFVTLTIIERVFPLLVLFGSCAVVIRMNSRLELGALRSSGLSILQIISGWIIIAFMAGLIQFLIFNPLSAYSSKKFETSTLGKFASSSSIIPGFKNSEVWFRQISGGEVMFIGANNGSVDPLVLNQVKVLHFGNDGRIKQTIYADRATIENNNWQLSDSYITKPDGSVEEQDIYQFANTLSASQLQSRRWLVSQSNFWELYEQITHLEQSGLNSDAYKTRLYNLISMPLISITMLLFAVAFCAYVKPRQSVFIPLIKALCAGILVYMVDIICEALGQSGAIEPIMAVWGPVLATILIAVTYLTFLETG